jgi:UTP:GlnB (protein PII) uridylyltransferase
MLSLADFTIENIKTGKLAAQLPEFYALKNIIENNAGHIHDPVFDHCVRTAEKLSEVLLTVPSEVRRQLQEQIGEHTRAELLCLAALLHDIGKVEVPMSSEGAFIGHEKAGAILVRDSILKKTNLSPVAQAHIVSIVEHHDVLHVLSNDANPQVNLSETIKKYPLIFPELILLVLADLIASDLSVLNPAVYNLKTLFFKDVLSKWPL